MKKNYIVPATMVQSIDMDNLMAASGGFDDVTDKKPRLDDVNNQFSKNHFSVWYDDKDEDDEETTYKVSSIWDE